MTELGDMTNVEIWEQIEDCFHAIHKDVANRCYSKHSMTGARHIQYLVRKNLIWIDRALLEIEIRTKSAKRAQNAS